MLTGLVMITSASMDVAAKDFGSAGHYIVRHGSFMLLALVSALVALRIPLRLWERFSIALLFIGLALLILVLVPGIGREVNGSQRWIYLGRSICRHRKSPRCAWCSSSPATWYAGWERCAPPGGG